MVPDGHYTAVVDRIEDGLASVLLEEDGEDAYEMTVDAARLPADGRHSDAVLEVTVSDGGLDEVSYDAKETDRRKQTAQQRFDRLSKRPPDDDS